MPTYLTALLLADPDQPGSQVVQALSRDLRPDVVGKAVHGHLGAPRTLSGHTPSANTGVRRQAPGLDWCGTAKGRDAWSRSRTQIRPQPTVLSLVEAGSTAKRRHTPMRRPAVSMPLRRGWIRSRRVSDPCTTVRPRRPHHRRRRGRRRDPAVIVHLNEVPNQDRGTGGRVSTLAELNARLGWAWPSRQGDDGGTAHAESHLRPGAHPAMAGKRHSDPGRSRRRDRTSARRQHLRHRSAHHRRPPPPDPQHSSLRKVVGVQGEIVELRSLDQIRDHSAALA
jgi:hypothetical protein